MKNYVVMFLAVALTFSCFPVGFAIAQDAEVQELKQQIKLLSQRLEKLESDRAQAKSEPSKPAEEAAKPRIDLSNVLSKLKLSGRFSAGYYDSGKGGSYSNGSFEVPDAKIQFAFEPDEINKLILRLSLNNAATALDYFYIDTDLGKFFDLPVPLSSRLGRQKLDFGEEGATNNVVQSVLPSNSAANVCVSDEGLQLSGKVGKEKSLGYVVSVTNGTSGTGSDTTTSKAFSGKLYYNLLDPLYVSLSYYDSGELKSSNAEMSIGGLVSRPTGATKWERHVWEADVRYDFGKGKILNPIAFSDSKAILRFAYGLFSDEATAAEKRSGQYGFLEGTYNFTKKFYVASRISLLNLDGDATASLNNVTAHEYQRYSLGFGYRLRANTILKIGYDWNRNLGQGVSDADDNLVSALVTAQF